MGSPRAACVGSRNLGARARKRSGGPHTEGGKRRAALNSQRRGLCAKPLERELKARGEDVREFRRLHRDLIGWLRPDDARIRAVVAKLAETWWRKRRRLRGAVGSAAPDTVEIDAQIDELLQLYVHCARERNRKWRHRLEILFGPGLSGPYFLRTRIEARLAALGGRPQPRRRASPGAAAAPPPQDPQAWIDRMLADALELLKADPKALELARKYASPGPAAHAGGRNK